MTRKVKLDTTRLLGFRPATSGKTGAKIGITKTRTTEDAEARPTDGRPRKADPGRGAARPA